MRRMGLGWCLAFGALTLGWASSVDAQRARDIERATEQLASNDAAQVREGLEALGLSGSPRAVRPIVDRVRRGLPPDLLGVAVKPEGFPYPSTSA